MMEEKARGDGLSVSGPRQFTLAGLLVWTGYLAYVLAIARGVGWPAIFLAIPLGLLGLLLAIAGPRLAPAAVVGGALAALPMAATILPNSDASPQTTLGLIIGSSVGASILAADRAVVARVPYSGLITLLLAAYLILLLGSLFFFPAIH
jgi:hypothetical protein